MMRPPLVVWVMSRRDALCIDEWNAKPSHLDGEARPTGRRSWWTAPAQPTRKGLAWARENKTVSI